MAISEGHRSWRSGVLLEQLRGPLISVGLYKFLKLVILQKYCDRFSSDLNSLNRNHSAAFSEKRATISETLANQLKQHFCNKNETARKLNVSIVQLFHSRLIKQDYIRKAFKFKILHTWATAPGFETPNNPPSRLAPPTIGSIGNALGGCPFDPCNRTVFVAHASHIHVSALPLSQQ